MNEKIYDPTGCVPLDMVEKMTDKEMIALTNEEIKDKFTGIERTIEKFGIILQGFQQVRVQADPLDEPEIKTQFNDLWDAVEKQNETAYTFSEYCKGFEHLCHAILYLKNFGLQRDSEAYITKDEMIALKDGAIEILEKIKGML